MYANSLCERTVGTKCASSERPAVVTGLAEIFRSGVGTLLHKVYLVGYATKHVLVSAGAKVPALVPADAGKNIFPPVTL